jgi:hypothetical protein
LRQDKNAASTWIASTSSLNEETKTRLLQKKR